MMIEFIDMFEEGLFNIVFLCVLMIFFVVVLILLRSDKRK